MGRISHAAAILGAAWAMAALSGVASPGAAQEARSRNEARCAGYATLGAELLARRGTAGLGRDFLSAHAAFLAAGCRSGPGLCPRTEAETAVANDLTILAMNLGAPSTFLPFRCP